MKLARPGLLASSLTSLLDESDNALARNCRSLSLHDTANHQHSRASQVFAAYGTLPSHSDRCRLGAPNQKKDLREGLFFCLRFGILPAQERPLAMNNPALPTPYPFTATYSVVPRHSIYGSRGTVSLAALATSAAKSTVAPTFS